MRDAEIHSAKGPKALENLFCPKGLQDPLLNAAASPSHSLSPFPARSKTSFVRRASPPHPALAPQRPFWGRREREGGFRPFVRGSGKAASQPGGQLTFSLLPPAWRTSPAHLQARTSSALPCCTRPGKGTAKRLLRGSRRGAERDSSPFFLPPCPS